MQNGLAFTAVLAQFWKNAGQLGLGSSRHDNKSAWSYFAYFFIRDASMNCVLYIKCSAKV